MCGASSKPLSRLPQGGEAKALPKQIIDLEIQHHHQPTSPFPFGKGGGIGPTHTPINRHNRGEVSYDASVG